MLLLLVGAGAVWYYYNQPKAHRIARKIKAEFKGRR